jgi:putative membrane protein
MDEGMSDGQPGGHKRWTGWYATLSVTDALAFERTYLATERTFLAHIRTSMAVLLAGLSFANLIPDARWIAGGYVAAVIGTVMVLGSVVRYRIGRRHLNDFAARAAALAASARTSAPV